MGTISDFHSHILPGIDDGSKSLDRSLAMLRLEAEQGIGHVVATPHFYAHHDTPEAFLARRAKAEALLREAVTPELPQLDVGAEVYYFNGISDADILPHLTVGGTSYVMIEMPMSIWTNRMYQELEDIYGKRGLTPIVAHVDRYISPFQTHHIPERLSELPVLVQANASFFLRRSTRRMALRMLLDGKIHLLGSDCHNLSDRAPNLGSVIGMIESKLGLEVLERIRDVEKDIFG